MVATHKKTIKLKAYSIINEIDLNKIAIDCGLKKKFTWEEPLILKNKHLENILGKKDLEDMSIMIFAFGSVVFINLDSGEELKAVNYLKKFNGNIDLKNWNKYKENYDLHIEETEKIEFENRYVAIPEYKAFYIEIIATTIAKSVALERTEEQVEKILDDIEPMIEKLKKGTIRSSNKKLAKVMSKILKHEHNSVSYVMILDKPEITWENSEADEFYEKTSNFFELNDRYKILKEKTNILNNIMEGFTNIFHSTRGFFIEWVIVALIVMEVVIMLVELFL